MRKKKACRRKECVERVTANAAMFRSLANENESLGHRIVELQKKENIEIRILSLQVDAMKALSSMVDAAAHGIGFVTKGR